MAYEKNGTVFPPLLYNKQWGAEDILPDSIFPSGMQISSTNSEMKI